MELHRVNAILASQAEEERNSIRVGKCKTLENAYNRYLQKGGDKLSIDEINAYIEGNKKVAAKNTATTNTTVNTTNINTNGLSQVLIAQAAIQAQLEEQRARNAKDGKLRLCYIDNPSVSALLLEQQRMAQ